MEKINNGEIIQVDEKLLEDFMNQVRQAKRGIGKKQFKAKSPLPGFVFLKKTPRFENNQEGVLLLLVIQDLGEGGWRCCKMSCYTWLAGIYDLFLEPEDWKGGYAVIIESWNSMILHEEDIGKEFISTIPYSWIENLLSLRKAYIENSDIPDSLLDYIGNPESTSEKEIFHEEEQLSMERLRMHCHEGWQGDLIWDYITDGFKVAIDGVKKIISMSDSGLDRLKEIFYPEPSPVFATGATYAFVTRGATTGEKLSEDDLEAREGLKEHFYLIPNDFMPLSDKTLKIKFKKTYPTAADKPFTKIFLRGQEVSSADVEWESWTTDEPVLLIRNCNVKVKEQKKAGTLMEIHYEDNNLQIDILPLPAMAA
ncbi:MAG: hypothetical protein WCJ37_02935 [Syntrophus sp. (in: bacteria)]